MIKHMNKIPWIGLVEVHRHARGEGAARIVETGFHGADLTGLRSIQYLQISQCIWEWQLRWNLDASPPPLQRVSWKPACREDSMNESHGEPSYRFGCALAHGTDSDLFDVYPCDLINKVATLKCVLSGSIGRGGLISGELRSISSACSSRVCWIDI